MGIHDKSVHDEKLQYSVLPESRSSSKNAQMALDICEYVVVMCAVVVVVSLSCHYFSSIQELSVEMNAIAICEIGFFATFR